MKAGKVESMTRVVILNQVEPAVSKAESDEGPFSGGSDDPGSDLRKGGEPTIETLF